MIVLRIAMCLLGSLLLLTSAAWAQGGAFMVDGVAKPGTVILGPELSREEVAAARDLARYLELITGGKVAVSNSAEVADGLRIHVGLSPYVQQQDLRLDTLARDGYVIRLLDPDNLAIVGAPPLGTGFAVYDFLKLVCGVRWYMPGPLGEVVPERESIILDGLDLRAEPSVPSAWLRPIDIANLKAKHLRRYHWAGHNLHRLVPPDQYGETHPEYYPLINGERRVPLGRRFPWQPCVTNPDLPGLVPAVAREHFAANPWSDVFSMGVNDGGGDCLCEDCTALDSIEGGTRFMGNRYATFYNACADRFAEQFPDKLLGFHAYGGIRRPPTSVQLRPNLYVRIAGGPDVTELIDAWSRQVQHLGVYEYLYGAQILEPRHYPHLLGDYVKWLVDTHHILSFSAEVYPFWPLDGPKCYVLGELLWNADQDVDALLDDYFGCLYGEAAAPMAAFFGRLEEVYLRRDNPRYFMDGFRRGGFRGWEAEDLDYLDARLDEAVAAARDETVQARVEVVVAAWRHLRCWLRIHVGTVELAGLGMADQDDAERALSLARDIQAARAEKDEWDGRVLDESLYPSAEYYKFYVASHYARPGALVQTETQAENEIEAAFERISGGLAGAEALWARVEETEAEGIARLAQTQRYLLAHGMQDPATVLADDFEGPGDGAPLDQAVLDQNRWERGKALPAGYGVWSYTGRPAAFVWTNRLARSGERCVGVEENEVQASILRSLDVRPGQRYRVRVAATRLPTEGEERDLRPHLTIAWQSEQGWTDHTRLTAEVQIEQPGIWQEMMVRVTVPPGARSMVVMLGVSGSQLGGGGTYFDDLRVTRLDPEAATQPGEG